MKTPALSAAACLVVLASMTLTACGRAEVEAPDTNPSSTQSAESPTTGDAAVPDTSGKVPGVSEKYQRAAGIVPSNEEMVELFGPEASDPLRRLSVFDPEAKDPMLQNQGLSRQYHNWSTACEDAQRKYDRSLTPNMEAVVNAPPAGVTVKYYTDRAKLDKWFTTHKSIHEACHSEFGPSQLSGGWKSVGVELDTLGNPEPDSTWYYTIGVAGNCYIQATSMDSQVAAENLALLTSKKCQ